MPIEPGSWKQRGRDKVKERVSRKERMTQIQKKLEEGVIAIYSSDKYKDYLRAMSRFPSYSANNCILIISQCPEASLVCGYKKWQSDFNRTVNKGEKGIMIMAPVKGKALVEEELFDEKNRLVRDEDGNPLTELVERQYQTFRPAYVFDISQTTGDPVPSLTEMLTGGLKSFDTLRDALIRISPVPVFFEKISGGANGYFSPSDMKIVIKKDLPEMQMIKTMIHEIAHASLGHGSKEDKWDRKTKELQAESVAYWVSQMIGIDTADYSFGYISGWSQDKDASDLKENIGIIKEAADRISTLLEEALKKKKDKELPLVSEPEPSCQRRKMHHR